MPAYCVWDGRCTRVQHALGEWVPQHSVPLCWLQAAENLLRILKLEADDRDMSALLEAAKLVMGASTRVMDASKVRRTLQLTRLIRLIRLTMLCSPLVYSSCRSNVLLRYHERTEW